MRRHLALAGMAALVLAACSDDPTGLQDNATTEDRQAVVEALETSGWFTDAFGTDGAAEDLNLATSFDLDLSSVAAQDTVPLVRRWGRRHGTPVNRTVTVSVTGDTARVEMVVTFDGVFVLDRTPDAVPNATQKPLQEQAVQRAVLVRREESDTAPRRWQLVALSPREWRMTDQAKRTVRIARVVVRVNDEVKLDVEDPAELFGVDNRIPRLRLGDSVSVFAEVENTTGIDNVPPTFVFLHVFHHGPNAQGWVRIPMRQRDDGVYVRHWIVRFPGRERIVVDAIDAQTFNTDTEDDYRANGWGIPYRIE
ncbi:MAG: hypothetical protein OEW06_02180 [Gemmatimonadota bacterium]|nr:hypothetical protein [Gemmatimonadota bacterium]